MCLRIGETRNTYRILVRKKILGKRTLERPRGRWEDNVEMNLRKVGCEYWKVNGKGSPSCTEAGPDISSFESSVTVQDSNYLRLS
jgi:hypothetical protein